MMHSSIAITSFGLAAFAAAAPAAADPAYIGCYQIKFSENNPLRAVQAIEWSGPSGDQSLSRCKTECGKKLPGAKLLGLTPVGCYCANGGTDALQVAPDIYCIYPCNNDKGHSCGLNNKESAGAAYMSMYGDASALPAPAFLTGLSSQKCAYLPEDPNDPNKHLPLKGPSYKDAEGMTVNTCTEFCVGKHSKKFIHLVGDTCYCADAALSNSDWVMDTCDALCPGDRRMRCGAASGGFVTEWKISSWLQSA